MKKKLPDLLARDFLVSQIWKIRTSTIHGVKGESIGCVLLVGDNAAHEEWLALSDEQETTVLYVAMTRAKDLLILGCPNNVIAERWQQLGFQPLRTAMANRL